MYFNKKVLLYIPFYIVFSYSEATVKKCNWAYHMFEDWKTERNSRASSDDNVIQIVRSLLEMPNWEIVYVLKRFIIEVRKKNW